ncbi:hypothetical protein [Novosphingobium sp. KN65.2]|uniref:hypothetical protein n=1 Tax=Novosphingobium sp. KN65.2 TaxID=1478134 RepID=UPI0005E9E6B9|nr:hypothetical protein [Novosphingobium sp. KN65.2]CDO38319.1 exported hypothetical protein [Novosphingobium sp. KN65.2]
MKTRSFVTGIVGALMLAAPGLAVAATASTASHTKAATASCKGLTGKALKTCKANMTHKSATKQSAPKSTAK